MEYCSVNCPVRLPCVCVSTCEENTQEMEKLGSIIYQSNDQCLQFLKTVLNFPCWSLVSLALFESTTQESLHPYTKRNHKETIFRMTKKIAGFELTYLGSGAINASQ